MFLRGLGLAALFFLILISELSSAPQIFKALSATLCSRSLVGVLERKSELTGREILHFSLWRNRHLFIKKERAILLVPHHDLAKRKFGVYEYSELGVFDKSIRLHSELGGHFKLGAVIPFVRSLWGRYQGRIYQQSEFDSDQFEKIFPGKRGEASFGDSIAYTLGLTKDNRVGKRKFHTWRAMGSRLLILGLLASPWPIEVASSYNRTSVSTLQFGLEHLGVYAIKKLSPSNRRLNDLMRKVYDRFPPSKNWTQQLYLMEGYYDSIGREVGFGNILEVVQVMNDLRHADRFLGDSTAIQKWVNSFDRYPLTFDKDQIWISGEVMIPILGRSPADKVPLGLLSEIVAEFSSISSREAIFEKIDAHVLNSFQTAEALPIVGIDQQGLERQQKIFASLIESLPLSVENRTQLLEKNSSIPFSSSLETAFNKRFHILLDHFHTEEAQAQFFVYLRMSWNRLASRDYVFYDLLYRRLQMIKFSPQQVQLQIAAAAQVPPAARKGFPIREKFPLGAWFPAINLYSQLPDGSADSLQFLPSLIAESKDYAQIFFDFESVSEAYSFANDRYSLIGNAAFTSQAFDTVRAQILTKTFIVRLMTDYLELLKFENRDADRVRSFESALSVAYLRNQKVWNEAFAELESTEPDLRGAIISALEREVVETDGLGFGAKLIVKVMELRNGSDPK